MALERFVAVHGIPETINSDAGANLLSTRTEIARQREWWRRIKQRAQADLPNVTWNVNPPYSPNWGGHYERLIGVVKRSLGRVAHDHVGAVGDEELITFFKRVQDLTNDRPITAVVQEDDSLLGLTPNCFLKTGRSGPLAPPGEEPRSLFRRHRLMENILNQYWKQFLREYVPTLHKTEKWFQETTPLKSGDIVSIMHHNTPRGRWPLGRIIKVYPGMDGRVRTVDVETKMDGRSQQFTRSASGLQPILQL